MPASPKRQLIQGLITAFRASGNQDSAFENLAADRLGVNRTDLHCLNAIENAAGLTAGELAAEVGLTSGAVTGVIDRLERAGFARRVPDPADRRRVKVEVTPEFYARAERIWGPLAAEWEADPGEPLHRRRAGPHHRVPPPHQRSRQAPSRPAGGRELRRKC